MTQGIFADTVVVIAGPTCVGKSEIADLLACQLKSEVISADSMQIYRYMDIGTAKVAPQDRRVPLRMVDVVDPNEAYSAACYQHDARIHIDRLLSNGDTPVMCGGTGLYLMAALDDMRFAPSHMSSPSRERYTQLAEELGSGGLYELLAQRDPRSAEVIHPHNVRRCIRALEMHDEGLCYADVKEGFSRPEELYPSHRFVLTMDREALYSRINARVDQMVSEGLVEEVENLIAKGYAQALTSMQAIGYKELIEYFDGKLSREEAIELIKRRTRRYAKRQISWFTRDTRYTPLDMDTLRVTDAVDVILSLLQG